MVRLPRRCDGDEGIGIMVRTRETTSAALPTDARTRLRAARAPQAAPMESGLPIAGARTGGHSGLGRVGGDTVLLTFKEAMDFLRVSRSTVYRLMWSGQLRGHKVGSTWRFYRSDLLEAVASPEYDPVIRRAPQVSEGQD